MVYVRPKQTKADLMYLRMFREDARREQKNRCKYCLEPFTIAVLSADHIEPMCAGGILERENIAAACAPCNSAKSNMPSKKFHLLLKGKTLAVKPEYMWAQVRYRIWSRTWQACNNIRQSVGLEAH